MKLELGSQSTADNVNHGFPPWLEGPEGVEYKTPPPSKETSRARNMCEKEMKLIQELTHPPAVPGKRV